MLLDGATRRAGRERLGMTTARDALLALIHPANVGEALRPGVKLTDLTTDFGLRLYLETTAGEYTVEVALKKSAKQFAAAGQEVCLSYRKVGRSGETDAKFGQELCRNLLSLMAPNEQTFAELVRHNSTEKRELPLLDAKLREVEVEVLLERIGSGAQQFWALNPYVGCLIGCGYCYAQDVLAKVRDVEGLSERRWGSYVDVRLNAPAVLRRELGQLSPLPIKFAPITTDPYQAVEKRYRITRGCLEVLVEARFEQSVLLLTRSALILDDLELIAQLRRPLVGVSLPTVDDEARRHFEPRGASVHERLDVLHRFRARGIPTLAVVQPLLPGGITELADALAAAADSVRLAPLESVYGAAEAFDDPRYRGCREDAYQQEGLARLTELLAARGVAVWYGEFPPSVGAAP
jgi:DNA repair photolyase